MPLLFPELAVCCLEADMLYAVIRFNTSAAASGDRFLLLISDEHHVNGKLDKVLDCM